MKVYNCKRLVLNIGINDSNFTKYLKNYKTEFELHAFNVWFSMITRCYSTRYKNYLDVTVCNEWLTFSKFRDWMEKQDYHGNVLDKDFLSNGKKVYSPETCVFIPHELNIFIKQSNNLSVGYTGVYKDNGLYRSKVRFRGTTYRGVRRRTALESYIDYLNIKQSIANKIVNEVTDHRVKDRLSTMYVNKAISIIKQSM